MITPICTITPKEYEEVVFLSLEGELLSSNAKDYGLIVFFCGSITRQWALHRLLGAPFVSRQGFGTGQDGPLPPSTGHRAYRLQSLSLFSNVGVELFGWLVKLKLGAVGHSKVHERGRGRGKSGLMNRSSTRTGDERRGFTEFSRNVDI